MKILLVSENKDLRELLSFQITSKVPVRVRECGSAREAVEILNKNEEGFQLVVGPYNGPESSLLQCLRARAEPLPIVLFYDSLIAQPDAAALQGLTVLGTVEHAKLVEGVVAVVQDFHQRGGEVSPDGEFCPIRTTLLIRATPLKSDIYIRLSKDKFLKLFRTGDDFDAADLQKYYESKGVEYMYLRRLETAEFLEKFRRDLDAMLAKPDLKPEEAAKAVEMNQDTIHELVHKVGFTEEVQDLAKKNVALTLKTIGSQPRLVDVLTKVTSGGNYLSNHSTLLAHLACCVAKEMQWGSESTFTKLILASYMHDISLSDPELAKMQTLEELEENRSRFPDDQVKGYHLHPARSADVVRSFKEIPADVDLIVQQHHERPNGSGFPRGLAHNYIAPLSALFVIAHDLTRAILDQPGFFSLQDFVEEKKPLFSQGNFKKVMAALEKASLA